MYHYGLLSVTTSPADREFHLLRIKTFEPDFLFLFHFSRNNIDSYEERKHPIDFL